MRFRVEIEFEAFSRDAAAQFVDSIRTDDVYSTSLTGPYRTAPFDGIWRERSQWNVWVGGHLLSSHTSRDAAKAAFEQHQPPPTKEATT